MDFERLYLIAVNIISVYALYIPFTYTIGNCDFTEVVMPCQIYSFTNPYWPSMYTAGTTCRWIYDCPEGYSCRLRCRDVGLPKTKGCYMDRLLVSTIGNVFFRDAQVYCGRSSINSTSTGSRIAMALKSSALSPGGRFRCTVRTEPWTHPWSGSSCSSY